MNPFPALLSWLCDRCWPAADGEEELVVRVQDVRHRYAPLRLFTSGDAADLHLATAAGEPQPAPETLYLLKIARLPDENVRLDLERKILTKLWGAAGNTTYRNYLPALVDSFPAVGRFPKLVNVFR